MFSLVMDGLLYFSHMSVVLGIIVLGWIFYDKKIFFYAACLCCFSVVINVALKGTFKVSLPSHLSPGYAFPSGHMQLSTVFYGWLFCHINHRMVRTLIVLLLFSLAIGMMGHQYHTLIEILAGFVTGALLIYLVNIVRKRHEMNLMIGLFIVASMMMVYNNLVYAAIPSYTWYAFAGLCLLIVANFCFYFFAQSVENETFEDTETRQEK